MEKCVTQVVRFLFFHIVTGVSKNAVKDRYRLKKMNESEKFFISNLKKEKVVK